METQENEVAIAADDIVTVTRMNHIIEIQHMEHMNLQASIKKLSKDTYMNIETGEIKEFVHIENRQQSYNSLRQTFKKLRYLINNNFTGEPNEHHITLTYGEHVTDPERLYNDFKRFMTRFRRHYKDMGRIDYINVVEPQESGRWHCHLLTKFHDQKKMFIDNNMVRKLWEQGIIVKTQSLKNVDNIGAYLSAYLADIELNTDTLMTAIHENREIESKIVDGEEKKFIKGGRLHLYPPGMNLYRSSRGIRPPEREKMKYKKAKKEVGRSVKPHYSKSIKIEADDFEQVISYEQYNTKR